MSLYPSARTRFPHPSTVGTKHKKKPPAPRAKPVWNDNLSDLNAYKATSEEVAIRKESRKSKNVDLARTEMQEKVIEKRIKAREKRPPTASEKRQIAILREILLEQNQDEFHDVLEQTDRALALVKDMFGDNPKKFTGLPRVTRAPSRDVTEQDDDVSSLPYCPEVNETRMDDLSRRVMAKTALNEIGQSDGQGSDEDEDLNFLRELDRRLQSEANADRSRQTSPKKELSGILQAMNDSGKILRSRSLLENKENQDGGVSRGSGTEVGLFIKQLDDLRKVLSVLETELRDYERTSGRISGPSRRHDGSLTGCTVQMADIVLTALRYTRQVDEELKSERRRTTTLSTQLAECKKLVDGLTSDFLILRDDFTSYRSESERKMATLERAHRPPATMVTGNPGVARTTVTMAPVVMERNEWDDEDEIERSVRPVPVPLHLAKHAYLLSPPTQRDTQFATSQSTHIARSKVAVTSTSPSTSPHVHFSKQARNLKPPPTAPPIGEECTTDNSRNLSEQIAELTREHQLAQTRISRLQNLHNALDSAASNDDKLRQPQLDNMAELLKLPVFDDVISGGDHDIVSETSTRHGIPSLPGDGDTPRSVTSLPCDVGVVEEEEEVMTSLWSDREVIDKQIDELAREHQMTQQRMKMLQEQLHGVETQAASGVSPAISPIQSGLPSHLHDQITIYLPTATNPTS